MSFFLKLNRTYRLLTALLVVTLDELGKCVIIIIIIIILFNWLRQAAQLYTRYYTTCKSATQGISDTTHVMQDNNNQV